MGINPNSQKMNQWKKLSAVKTPNMPVSSRRNSRKNNFTLPSCFQEASKASGMMIAVSRTIVMLRPSTARW